MEHDLPLRMCNSPEVEKANIDSRLLGEADQETYQIEAIAYCPIVRHDVVYLIDVKKGVPIAATCMETPCTFNQSKN